MIFIKKIFTLLLSVITIATFLVPVFADDNADIGSESTTDQTVSSAEETEVADLPEPDVQSIQDVKTMIYSSLESIIASDGFYVFYDISIEEVSEGYNVSVTILENQYVEQVLIQAGITDLSKADYILKNVEDASKTNGINYSVSSNNVYATFLSEFTVQSLSEIGEKIGLTGFVDFVAPQNNPDEDVYAVVINKDLESMPATRKTQYYNYALLHLTINSKNQVVSDAVADNFVENSGGLNSYEWLITPSVKNGMCVCLYSPPVFKTHFYVFAIISGLIYIIAYFIVSLFLKNKKKYI